jgi:hypothetical protein
MREERLMEYRRKHLGEIETAFKKEIEELKSEHLRKSREDFGQVDSLTRSLDNAKPETISAYADSVLALRRKAELASQDREKAIKTRGQAQGLFIRALTDPGHQEYYLREMREKEELIVLNSGISTSEEYLDKLTKECPGCKVRIAKEDGCNQVQCKRCNFLFCWHCGKAWASHGDHFGCNEFEGSGKLEISGDGDPIAEEELNLNDKQFYPAPLSIAVRAQCVRLQHYQRRFRAHKESQGFDAKDRDVKEEDMVARLQLDTTAEKAKILARRLFTTLDRGRSVTMWSYPCAFLIPEGDLKRKKFESNQGYLEMALERCAALVYKYRDEGYSTVEEVIQKLTVQVEGLLKERIGD